MVKDVTSIFGISIEGMKKYDKKRKLVEGVALGIDILLVVLLTVLLTRNSSNFVEYIATAIFISILVRTAVSMLTRTDYRQVVQFYKKNKRKRYVKESYKVTDDNMFSILFCAGLIGVTPGQSKEIYLEMMKSACYLNCKYARRIMKYLSKYKDDDGDLCCYVTVERKPQFIDIVK